MEISDVDVAFGASGFDSSLRRVLGAVASPEETSEKDAGGMVQGLTALPCVFLGMESVLKLQAA